MDQKEMHLLLGINTSKMNYQQNMCFQIQNWAIAITTLVLGIVWKSSSASLRALIINLAFHIFLLICLIVMKRSINSWKAYFFIFRERASLVENLITKVEKITEENFQKEYYKFHAYNEKFPKNTLILPEVRFEKLYRNYIFRFLYAMTIISLTLTIYLYA